eukprot:TRINITY_DN18032_c0_g1_i1.p1 TRINITY_DN18032_c0_g1~~TRINITY_DN18032_c0_g1_i1.p1  ORF type:complete len:640 (+),score=118.74 TRINITY_DN18032_c0_g1_i1:76-1920(+)
MPSDAEEEQYHEIFELMGGDPTRGSERGVGFTDLAKFFRELPDSPPMCQIEEIFKQCDEDGNGEIDPDEFINVVETIKLLQNKTTNEIIDSFVGTHFKDIFSILDADGTGALRKEDVRLLFEKIPDGSKSMSAAELLRTIIQAESSTGKVELAGFKHIAALAVPKLKISQHLAALKDVATDIVAQCTSSGIHPTRSSTSIVSNLSRVDQKPSSQSLVQSSPGVTDPSDCPNCGSLRARIRDIELQLETERLHTREARSKEELSSAKEQKSERLNRDLCFENEQLKKRLRTYENDTQSRQQDAKVKEAGTAQLELIKQKEVLEKDIQNLTAELDANKKALSKQKAESGRQSAALALLHKHIATLERDNEVLKRGGDRIHVQEQMQKTEVLNSMLAEANKKIEGYQQENWYQSNLRYLNDQKNGGSSSVIEPSPAAPLRPSNLSKRSFLTNSTSTDRSKHKERPVETATVDPSDPEYKVLSAYYHHFQASTNPHIAQELIEECSAELDKVNTHHPAYWSGKNNLRIKIWMKQPVLSDSAAAANARKKYVVTAPSSQRSGSHNSSQRSSSYNARTSVSPSPVPRYATTSRSPDPPPAYPHARSISPPRKAVIGRKLN